MHKGSMFDIIFLLISISAVMIVAIVSYLVLTAVTDNSALTATFNEAGVDKADNLEKGQDALKTFDLGLTFLVIMIGLVTVVLAAMINTNPVFFFGSLIVLIVMVMVTAMISNVFFDVTSNELLATATDQFPLTVLIMQIYPTICLVLSIIVAIVMYSKTSQMAGFGAV